MTLTGASVLLTNSHTKKWPECARTMSRAHAGRREAAPPTACTVCLAASPPVPRPPATFGVSRSGWCLIALLEDRMLTLSSGLCYRERAEASSALKQAKTATFAQSMHSVPASPKPSRPGSPLNGEPSTMTTLTVSDAVFGSATATATASHHDKLAASIDELTAMLKPKRSSDDGARSEDSSVYVAGMPVDFE